MGKAPSYPRPVDGLGAYQWRARPGQLPLTGFRAHWEEPVALVPLPALMLVDRPSCSCIRQELEVLSYAPQLGSEPGRSVDRGLRQRIRLGIGVKPY